MKQKIEMPKTKSSTIKGRLPIDVALKANEIMLSKQIRAELIRAINAGTELLNMRLNEKANNTRVVALEKTAPTRRVNEIQGMGPSMSSDLH